jgi:uncharacterized protein
VRALSVPFKIGSDGRISTVSGEFPVYATYLRSLLLTRIGERVMRPKYGSRVLDSLFEPNDETLEAELGADIRDSVSRWEPRVRVRSLVFDRNEDAGTVRITLEFEVVDIVGGGFDSVSITISGTGVVVEET